MSLIGYKIDTFFCFDQSASNSQRVDETRLTLPVLTLTTRRA